MNHIESIIDKADEELKIKTEITLYHKKIENGLLSLRKTIVSMFANEGVDFDPSGWRVYAFDSGKVTADQVTAINPSDADIEPFFDIYFNPIVEKSTSRKTYFKENGPNKEFSPAMEREAESINIFLYSGEKAILYLYPIAQSDPEWTEMKIEPNEMYGAIELLRPKVISSTKNDEVVVVNIRPNEVNEAIFRVSYSAMQISEIAEGIKNGKFHFRIFGNVDRRFGLQEPHFIISQIDKQT